MNPIVTVHHVGPKTPAAAKSVDFIRKIVLVLEVISPLMHRIRIRVAPLRAIDAGNGERAYGAFIPRKEPRILIAGHHPGGLSGVAMTLFHEWTHYEQLRDGKLLSERGVTARSKTLEKRVGDFFTRMVAEQDKRGRLVRRRKRGEVA